MPGPVAARRWRTVSVWLLGIAFFTAAPALPAQVAPAAPAAPAAVAEVPADRFLPLEAEWHRLEGDLQSGELADRLIAFLRTVAGGVRQAALAEHAALRLCEVTRELAARDGWVETWRELAASPLAEEHPFLRDVYLLQLLGRLQGRGDEGGAARVREELGMLTGFWIVGPFDNERGAGFDREHSPRKAKTGFDPGATYEGKKRDVQWRELPIVPPDGYVDLGALVRPDAQVLAYAATALISDRAQTVALRLGSAQAFRVYLNGVEVYGRDLRRDFAFDQEAIALALCEGANLLLVQVGTQEGGFGFAARLRGLDGRPVKGVQLSTARTDMTAAAAREPRAADTDAGLRVGARMVFADAGGAADTYRLARVLAFYGAEDFGSPRVRQLLQATVDALPDAAAPRLALAEARVDRGASQTEEKESNQQRHDCLALLERHPGHAAARLHLAELDRDGARMPVAAEQHIERALAAQSARGTAGQVRAENPPLLFALASVHAALGLQGLAVASLKRAAEPDAAGRFHLAARRRWAQEQTRYGYLAEALAAWRDVVASGMAAEDVSALARLALRIGQREGAVELLEQGIRALPFAPELRRQYAAYLRESGELEGAMQQVEAWLRICPEDDGFLVEQARLHGLAGDVERQLTALRAAITLNPNRKEERRHLEFLEAEEKAFYEPYEVDSAALIAADPGPPADAASANDPYYYLLDHRVVRAYRNGTTSDYRHFVLRILNAQGAQELANYYVRHYPGEQRARLLEVKVVKKEGGEVMRPTIQGSGVRLPPLVAGDVVDIRYRIDDLAPGFFGEYFGLQHHFARGSPSQRSSLTLVLDAGRDYRTQVANGAPQPRSSTDAKGRTVLEFGMQDLERFDDEERQPGRAESTPLARVTTYADWDAFSSWWWNLIRNQTEVSPAIRAKVQELTAGLDGTAAKIDAIYKFVTTDVRYKAWEFGVHGYKPYTTPVIFERRHGDCKDKSLLLNAMLSEIGVEAHPVLIQADPLRSKDDLSLAMVSHFNHCISWVEPTDATPGMFLDGTATYHPVGTLPDMDYGAEVLIVKGREGAIRSVTWPAPVSNRDETEIRVELASTGDANVRLLLRPTGNQAVWVRDFLGNEPAKRRENLERIVKNDFGAVQIGSFELSDLDDLGAPVRVDVAFAVTGFAARQGEDLVLDSAIGPRQVGQLAITETRRHPLLVGVPASERQVIEYVLPDGFGPLSLPEPVGLETPFGSCSLRWEQDGTTLRVRRDLLLTATRVEPADYPAFRRFVTRVEQANLSVVVVSPGKRAVPGGKAVEGENK